MPTRRLSPVFLADLRILERKLAKAVDAGEPDRAVALAARVQELFAPNRHHHRLLRAKLSAFESCLDANRWQYAESGFLGIRRSAGKSTRLYLEASVLLAVCYLRKKEIPEAKQVTREVLKRLNNIQSDRKRQQFQRRVIDRIEEESVLASLLDTQVDPLNAREIQEAAERLAERSSDREIYTLIGDSLPTRGLSLLREVRAESVKQLPSADRKMLPAPSEAAEPPSIGKKAFAALKRVSWKTLCAKDSPVYKLWSKRIPKVFDQGYFSAAIVTTFGDLRIGIPLIASGLVALAMRYSAEEFCEIAKPKGIMTSRAE